MTASITALQGEVAALAAAFLWAVSTLLFGRLGKHLSPLLLNLTKGILAIGMMGLTLVLSGQGLGGLAPVPMALLLLSGAIGIGLGDTAYFSAINSLGARRALLLETLAPPLAAVMALAFLGERLSPTAWLGILLTLLGVAWVISERVPGTPLPTDHQGHNQQRQGLIWGGLAALGQATGAVLSRAALAGTLMDPLWSTLLRLGGGLGVLTLLLRLQGPVYPQVQPLRSRRLLGAVAIAALLGTYLGIWLQQTSLKYAPTGIAQALTATSPLFILPLAALVGERVTWRASLGVIVAIGGIWLLIAGR